MVTIKPVLIGAAIIGLAGCATGSPPDAQPQDSVDKQSAAQSDSAEAEKIAEAANADNGLTKEQRVQKRKALVEMSQTTLLEVATDHPDVYQKLEDAFGYAVFDSNMVNLILYVAGKGSGVAFDNSSHQPIYMNMVRAGTGPGAGYKEYRQLLIFESKGAYQQFITTGIDIGASADLGPLATGAVSFNPDIVTYTISDGGFDIQANWGGLWYVKSFALNE